MKSVLYDTVKNQVPSQAKIRLGHYIFIKIKNDDHDGQYIFMYTLLSTTCNRIFILMNYITTRSTIPSSNAEKHPSSTSDPLDKLHQCLLSQ